MGRTLSNVRTCGPTHLLYIINLMYVFNGEIRGQFNKFVELGIFLYNSRFLFLQCKPLSVDDNSRSVNTYVFCSYFLFENLYP